MHDQDTINQFIELRARWVPYAQIADHPGRNEPSTGEIYYPRVMRELKTLGYDGYVGLELRPKTTELAAAIAVNEMDGAW